ESGMGFVFARIAHAAMRHAAPVRAELGVPTIFNYLGPLSNPARPGRQVVGVSDPTMAQTLLGVLAANGANRAMVVYGHDGLDELSLAAPSTALWLEDGGAVRTMTVEAAELGLAPAPIEAIAGGDPAANAALARRVLDGEPGPHRDVVVLNAAAALLVAGRAGDLAEGVAIAKRSIDDGAAATVLERLVEVSNAAAAAVSS
ncbi:MAG: anthranilate phosphoribosyltransferase, partial [Actinobacteria bacterium]